MDSIVSAKGWVVIPKKIRERYGIAKGTRVRFVEYGGVIGIVPVPRNAAEAIEALYGKYANGPSMTDDLLADHAAEIEREEQLHGDAVRAG